MQHIPVELMYLIVTYLLTSPSTLFALRLVSRKFRALLIKPLYLNLLEEAGFASLRKHTRYTLCSGNAIFDALDLGNIEAFACLVYSGYYNLNTRNDKDGTTVFLFAVKQNLLKALKILVRNGAKFDDLDNYGNSAMHIAALTGNFEIMSYLIKLDEKGRTLNMANFQGLTPLHVSARSGNYVTCKLLLSQPLIKTSSKTNIEGRTPFHMLMTSNPNFKVVKLFSLECRSSMYEKDANGYTIMHLAAIHGCNAESTQLLLDSGISVDDMDLLGNTALHLAVVHDSSELAAVLVKNGANIYFKNAQSVRPVDQVAAENLSSVNMMKVLKGKSSNNYGKIGILALLVLTTKQIL